MGVMYFSESSETSDSKCPNKHQPTNFNCGAEETTSRYREQTSGCSLHVLVSTCSLCEFLLLAAGTNLRSLQLHRRDDRRRTPLRRCSLSVSAVFLLVFIDAQIIELLDENVLSVCSASLSFRFEFHKADRSYKCQEAELVGGQAMLMDGSSWRSAACWSHQRKRRRRREEEEEGEEEEEEEEEEAKSLQQVQIF